MTALELKAAYEAGRLSKPEYVEAMSEKFGALHDFAALLEKTGVESIALARGEVAVTLRDTGVKLISRRGDKREVQLDVLNFGSFEKEEMAMAARLVPSGGLVLDVGAHAGWWALTLARLRPRARIHAFEPVPDTFARLRRHVALNGLSARIKPHAFGFSDQKGRGTFYFSAPDSTAASRADITGKGRRVACRLERLDDFAQGRKIGFLKCDVEGGELFVFKGGLKTLARDTPVILTEMLRKWAGAFGYHPNELIDLLGGLGYRCYTVKGRKLKPFGRMTEKTVETNFFFLHPAKFKLGVSPRLKFRT